MGDINGGVSLGGRWSTVSQGKERQGVSLKVHVAGQS